MLLAQQECDIGAMVQGKTVERFRDYFPDAEINSAHPCILSVETGVDGVSRKLITELAHRIFEMPDMRELITAMEFTGYNYFLLGFTDYNVVFDRVRSRYYVFDSAETARFFQLAPNICFR